MFDEFLLDQDATWHGGWSRPRPHFARGAQLPKWGTGPQFLVHICCGQMVGWIKIPLCREVDLDPSNIAFDVDPAPPPPKKGTEPPIFGPCLLWSNGWMDQDVIWYGGRPQLRRRCVRWGPSSPPKRGTALSFPPISIVAKRLDG